MNLKTIFILRKMENLPKDVYIEILTQLNIKDVLNISLTAKRYNVMNNENFWRRKMAKDGYKDLFAQYLSTFKEKYKLAHQDHSLIIREMNLYFDESLGKFSKYLNIETYKKDFLSAVYQFREDILQKKFSRNEYGDCIVPKNVYDLFPSYHVEVYDDFDSEYIFDNLIYPLLHREFTENNSDEESFSPEIQVQEIECGLYREMMRGFIIARIEEGLCALKVDENGIWRDLTEAEQQIAGSLELMIRLPDEEDKKVVEKVTIYDDELCIQYVYFEDITITLHHHFVIYKNEIAFKIADGPIWRPLNLEEKRIAVSLGLRTL